MPAISDTRGARLKLMFMTFPMFYRKAKITDIPAQVLEAEGPSDSTHHEQHEQYDKYYTGDSARPVTPLFAVWPGRNYPQQDKHNND